MRELVPNAATPDEATKALGTTIETFLASERVA
jgi:hypothetical protein